ncbi:MAG: YggS family pyridoxal phosphate-dependent enzyme [Ktedonobacteraceae bacterium]
MRETAMQENAHDRLATNIAHVRASITEAAQRGGRDANDITLVAVSKTVAVELVKIAYNLGVTHFGENRVQDALPKIAEFRPRGVYWHMIGHVQSNKASKVVAAFDSVQSVDSLHLAQALQRHAEEEGKRLPVLLQVNVSGEASKEGMTVAETPELARQIAELPALEVQGLMTIAPLVEQPEEVRPVFRALRELRERLQNEVPDCSWQHLSMGMTDDYRIAIEEGATIVRVGRAIFGERVYKGVTS